LVADEERDRKLTAFGLKVLRYSNEDVLKNIGGVLEEIYLNLNPPESSFKKGGK